MDNAKKYRVAVDRIHTVRSIYEISSTGIDSEDFQNKVVQCLSGNILPSETATGMEQGNVFYEELPPINFVVDSPLPEKEAELHIASPERPASYILDLDKDIQLHQCPYTEVPYIVNERTMSRQFPFEWSIGIENTAWMPPATVVHSRWTDMQFNLDLPTVHEKDNTLFLHYRHILEKHVSKEIYERMYRTI